MARSGFLEPAFKSLHVWQFLGCCGLPHLESGNTEPVLHALSWLPPIWASNKVI